MGIDAYAIDRDGKRLATRERTGRIHPELIDAEQQRLFAGTARQVASECDGVDADFDVGALCISANATTVYRLLWAMGARCNDELQFPPEAVLHVSIGLKETTLSVFKNMGQGSNSSVVHAQAFVHCCAKLGLGIEISP